MKKKLPEPNEIDDISKKLMSKYFPRLVIFADIINRYVDIVFKDRIDWLKTGALLILTNIGKGSMTPTELARNLLRSNQNMTKLIDRLEKEGLVSRYRLEKDRRIITVKVTSAGLSYLVQHLRYIDEVDEKVISCLNKRDKETLANSIRKLRRTFIQKINDQKTLL